MLSASTEFSSLLGATVVTTEGNTVTVTADNIDNVSEGLSKGDIIYYKSGAITSVNGTDANIDQDVILDSGGENALTKGDTSDDVATAKSNDTSYGGFWARLMGAGNAKQDERVAGGKNYANRNTELGAKPTQDKGTNPGNSNAIDTPEKAAAQLYNDPKLDQEYYTRDELRQRLSEAPPLSKESKEAIEYLLKNDAAFNKIDGINTQGQADGTISKKGLGKQAGLLDSTGAPTGPRAGGPIDTTSSGPNDVTKWAANDKRFYNPDGSPNENWYAAREAAPTWKQKRLDDEAKVRAKGARDGVDTTSGTGNDVTTWRANDNRFYNADGTPNQLWDAARAAALPQRQAALDAEKNRRAPPTGNESGVDTTSGTADDVTTWKANDDRFYGKDGKPNFLWDAARAASPLWKQQNLDTEAARRVAPAGGGSVVDVNSGTSTDVSTWKANDDRFYNADGTTNAMWDAARKYAPGWRKENLDAEAARRAPPTGNESGVDTTSGTADDVTTWSANDDRFYGKDGKPNALWDAAYAAAPPWRQKNLDAEAARRVPKPPDNTTTVDVKTVSATDPRLYTNGKANATWQEAWAAAAGDPARQEQLIAGRIANGDAVTGWPANDPAFYSGGKANKSWFEAFDAGDDARKNDLIKQRLATEKLDKLPATDPASDENRGIFNANSAMSTLLNGTQLFDDGPGRDGADVNDLIRVAGGTGPEAEAAQWLLANPTALGNLLKGDAKFDKKEMEYCISQNSETDPKAATVAAPASDEATAKGALKNSSALYGDDNVADLDDLMQVALGNNGATKAEQDAANWLLQNPASLGPILKGDQKFDREAMGGENIEEDDYYW